MRGRTNVPQRVRPTVNGDIISATVEGGAISVGDFVEYNVVPADEEVASSAIGDGYGGAKDVGQNYKVGYRDGYLTLWDKTTMQPVSSLNLNIKKTTLIFTVLSNGDIVVAGCVPKTYSSAYVTTSTDFLYIIIDDGELTIVNDALNKSLSCNISGICELDSTHVLVFGKGTNWNGAVFTYDSTNGIGSTFLPTNNKSFSSYAPDNCYAIEKIADGYVAFFGGYSSASGTGLRAYLLSVADNGDNTYKWNDRQTISCSTYVKTARFSYERLASNTFMFFVETGKISIVSFTTSTITLDLNQSITYSDLPSGTILDTNPGCWLLAKLGSNKCLGWFSANSNVKKYCVVFTYDDTLGTITVSNLLEVNKYGYMAYFNALTDIALTRVESSKTYQLRIGYDSAEDMLIGMVDTNRVKPYTGGRAIGFAKTGGAVGANIQVYIPHQS